MNERPPDPGMAPLKKEGWLSWLRRDRREEQETCQESSQAVDETQVAAAAAESSSPALPLSSPESVLAQASSSVLMEEQTGYLGEIPALPVDSPAVESATSLPGLPPLESHPLAAGGAAATGDSRDEAVPPQSWFQRLKKSLHRSSSRLTQGIVTLFITRRLDSEAIEELEELLIAADLGVNTAASLVAHLATLRFNQEVTAEEIRSALATNIYKILEPVAQPLLIDRAAKPHVILVVGVNGSGKTTTLGKMAHQFHDAGLRVSLAAGDTFRAAAVEQLKVWGERTGCPVVARASGADAAGLAFDALKEAKTRGDDVLLIDTAGRLQNKGHLMAELEKIVRVLRKLEPAAPHTCLLVLDATIGQNAHIQVDVFRRSININSLAVTKLDGTARGGVLVALAEKFKLPVHYVGIGERVEDLRPFSARDFARSLLGFDS
ncbi:Signal recognition particle receptor protein FtsY (=alpha subunit) (TC 3.A.5.1.1) [invertebrate metagenome]|uniref:Signal recognition particle receptor protein FtsY (=alpha subunit) (TC 3.A.5.1.1) n=1 Tax=invertebrate metagenome TaxID=1711999 RepID=A0A484H6E4_9ZZZZ